ncbi:MAG: GTP-binding protein [Woeseia sp.]|nr:50S ribosome-binding GTPase [Woeseia sp.]MBT8097884.1 50S ribosome-binding GTPase [Woeseia sp.]NNE59903.1 GTP-binding protein [Woeseia sp.]NNL54284.1 GTP-binding protein [Woeseia sp.]
MKVDKFIRVAIAALIVVAMLIALAALLFVTESALNVWDRLREGPSLLLYGYVAAVALLVGASLWFMLRLVVRRRPRQKKQVARPLTRAEIEERLRSADDSGIDTRSARAELSELASRQQARAVHLCFFGEISSGKSSLVRALVPAADVKVSAVGGSTLDIQHYEWTAPDGARVLLTDVPGTGGVDAGLDQVAEQEARRAHIVLFVTDGDLARIEKDALRRLLQLDKPLILILNKSDRYDATEQAQLIGRLLEHLNDLGGSWDRDQVVAVSAGGESDVIERQADGREQLARRTRPADTGVLVVAINSLLAGDAANFDERRDRAIFRLAADKLADAEQRYRKERAEQIIRSSTRKAVIGALAAVSPGTDVIIQGYIGTTMTRGICRLYGAEPRDLDIEEFLTLSQSRAGRALPLSLAVAGNGLKAFPGVGTVAGGLAHAVAYGLIFDALGHSLILTLEKHGELQPARAADEFGENFGEHIEAGVKQVVGMALAEKDRNG